MTKEELQKIVGNKIKEARIEKNITQQELAAICNFEKSSMSRIEAGRTNITLHTLYTIAKALNLDMHFLLKEIE
jgi:transcriptional regulator with XRE-family HTH domain